MQICSWMITIIIVLYHYYAPINLTQAIEPLYLLYIPIISESLNIIMLKLQVERKLSEKLAASMLSEQDVTWYVIT